MPLQFEQYHRRSIRIKDFDYSQIGPYFITICVKGNACRLGEVVDGEMRLSREGEIAAESWLWLATQYGVELDYWTVMPNHSHGVILIRDRGRGGSRTAPTQTIQAAKAKNLDRRGGSRAAPTSQSGPKPLGGLIGAFKTVSTKKINGLHGTPGATFWQRNYYEHIIRDENSLDRIREYIVHNPLRWMLDRENLDRQGEDEFDRWLQSFSKSSTSKQPAT
jgi:REP element-mobilizing transposase RayT